MTELFSQRKTTTMIIAYSVQMCDKIFVVDRILLISDHNNLVLTVFWAVDLCRATRVSVCGFWNRQEFEIRKIMGKSTEPKSDGDKNKDKNTLDIGLLEEDDEFEEFPVEGILII